MAFAPRGRKSPEGRRLPRNLWPALGLILTRPTKRQIACIVKLRSPPPGGARPSYRGVRALDRFGPAQRPRFRVARDVLREQARNFVSIGDIKAGRISGILMRRTRDWPRAPLQCWEAPIGPAGFRGLLRLGEKSVISRYTHKSSDSAGDRRHCRLLLAAATKYPPFMGAGR